jgi:aminoglycoside 6'-N-acetyltransferase I
MAAGQAAATITIRAYAPADRADFTRVWLALFPDSDAAVDIPELLARVAAGTTALFVIARDAAGAGALGGFVEVGWRAYADGCDTSPVGYIEAWYVDADLRRGGLGRRLIDAAAEWVRAGGGRELASDALVHNEVSIAAHQALGFDEMERLVVFRRRLAR